MYELRKPVSGFLTDTGCQECYLIYAFFFVFPFHLCSNNTLFIMPVMTLFILIFIPYHMLGCVIFHLLDELLSFLYFLSGDQSPDSHVPATRFCSY
jgi:hypothetical protein